MRYYKIAVTNATSGAPVLGFPLSSLNSDGSFNLGALNVEFDIPIAQFGIPGGQQEGAAFVRVWGIPLTWINQAANLHGMGVQVFGGMSKGLPLANPAQQGLLCQGQVFQAFANWVGTAMTLDMQIVPAGIGSPNQPNYHTLYWRAGTTLADAIRNTLLTKYPQCKIQMNIGSYVLAQDEIGYYPTLGEFAYAIMQLSNAVEGGTGGVQIVQRGNNFYVYDATYQPPVKQLQPTDFIGQPTWISPNEIQMYLVMRGDLTIGDLVAMPTAQNGQGLLAYTTAQSYAYLKNQSIFKGTFRVTQIRHVGNFKSPDALNWITTVNAVGTQAN